MLRLNYFATAWVCGKITLIQKPGKPPTSLTNYRHLTLPPIMPKILEKMIVQKCITNTKTSYQTINLDLENTTVLSNRCTSL